MKKLPPVIFLLIFFSVSIGAQPKEFALAEKYDRLADSLSQIPDYQQAILYRKRALNIYQTMRPVPYERVVMEHRSIGIFYRRAGQIRESEYYQRRAVEIAEKKLPPTTSKRPKPTTATPFTSWPAATTIGRSNF